MKRWVLGMSREMRDVKREVESKSAEIALHLAKLGMYPDNDSKMHWRQEVYSFLFKVPRLKSTNKFPKSDKLFDWLWDSVKDEIRDWGRGVIREYGRPSGMTLDEVEVFCAAYYDWLSTNLSRHGIVTQPEVYSKLDELGF